MRKKLWVLGEYLGHLLIGTVMFAALLAFGGALHMLVQWATPIIGDSTFGDLMIIVEKIILYADIVFIVWWAIFSTYKAIKEMMSHE